MKRFLESVFKVQSSSAAESLEALNHFGGILDHCIKVVTTIGLLVGLQIVWQKHSNYLAVALYWWVGIMFMIYLLRLIEHSIIFLLENRTEIVAGSDTVRWIVGTISFIVSLSITGFGNDALTKLVEINFLQGG